VAPPNITHNRGRLDELTRHGPAAAPGRQVPPDPINPILPVSRRADSARAGRTGCGVWVY